MIGPFGRQGPAATLRQHCPRMTQRRCTVHYALSYITIPREGEVPPPGLRRSYDRDEEDQTDLDENAHRDSDSE